MKSHKIFFLLLSIIAFSCSSSSQSIGVEDFEKRLKSDRNAILIDVRTPEEYSEGHLKSSVNIDYNNPDFAKQIMALDKAKNIYVYCRSGKRSAEAFKKFKGSGFGNVFNLDGGIIGWQENNKEIVK